MPNRHERTGGLEGPSATSQQVGPVVGLQHPHKIGTLHLSGRGAGGEGLLTISLGPKARTCLAGQLWGSGVTVSMGLQEASGSVSDAPSTGTGKQWAWPQAILGCWSALGALVLNRTHQRVSSLPNTRLPLFWLWWPQDLKHSLVDPRPHSLGSFIQTPTRSCPAL